ncbi:uncharacterized protein G6M90_00g028430 [Metarhizium brunneum]|uniref:Uncharacterized protein n=1 Tax=Metarhizium brunneum TaxID=500148 RepID=A0A7D5Z0P6_9HYPO|nr:hypothetical protein G6M90_00g028430 [Metarhizium brunneum]
MRLGCDAERWDEAGQWLLMKAPLKRRVKLADSVAVMNRQRTIYLELTSVGAGPPRRPDSTPLLAAAAPSATKLVIVASENPVKIGAARDGSSRMFPGVPDQPSTDQETLGSVGILTGDVVRRQSYYSEDVALALIPLKRAQLAF